MIKKIIQNQSLASLTSWKVGGSAEYFFEPETYKDIAEAVEWAEKNGQELTVLGGGSNVLISDKGISGLVLYLGRLNQLTVKEEDGKLKISAQAGVPKSELGRAFLKKRLAPAVFLAGLPGDVGGGVVMNAGVGDSITPKEFVEITEWVEIYRLDQKKFITMNADDLTWSYRKCKGWQPGIIVQAGFHWELKETPDIVETVFAANRLRMSKQPLNLPSCGSVFKNPTGDKAGRLIDSCGLKGFQIGQAQVSPKHANFIVNLGGAKASDIDQVIQHVKKTVSEKTKINLEAEVVYLGEW
jgi:UDP-N-acetylmuramate dehydrogenase